MPLDRVFAYFYSPYLRGLKNPVQHVKGYDNFPIDTLGMVSMQGNRLKLGAKVKLYTKRRYEGNIMQQSKRIKLIHKTISIIAFLFGLVTVITGYRVLTGFDPGYHVFFPLLVFNTTMGLIYIVTSITSWYNPTYGKYLAATIFTLNLFMLIIISYLYVTESSIAVKSLRAMSFRTIIWFMLLLTLSWICRKNRILKI